jgi:AcrR family transcriptional regulator
VTATGDPNRGPSAARRSQRAHDAVLDTAIALFEQRGYARLTIDGIAARAGVSKATIYRWWPSKAAVLLEAFLTRVEADVAFPETGSVREDLVEQIAALAHLLAETRLGAMAISLLGEAQHDAELARAFRDGWLEPRRVVGRDVLRRAIDRGELRADLDLDAALDALYGPLYLRVLFGHGSLERAALGALVDQALRGLAPP